MDKLQNIRMFILKLGGAEIKVYTTASLITSPRPKSTRDRTSKTQRPWEMNSVVELPVSPWRLKNLAHREQLRREVHDATEDCRTGFRNWQSNPSKRWQAACIGGHRFVSSEYKQNSEDTSATGGGHYHYKRYKGSLHRPDSTKQNAYQPINWLIGFFLPPITVVILAFENKLLSYIRF